MTESQSASRRSFVNNIKYDNDGDVCARDEGRGGGGGVAGNSVGLQEMQAS